MEGSGLTTLCRIMKINRLLAGAACDQLSTKCKCPIVIRGMLNDRRVSLSTAKFLPPDKARDLEAARDLALLWERSGSPIRPEEYAQAAPVASEPTPPRPTVGSAIAAYMTD